MNKGFDGRWSHCSNKVLSSKANLVFCANARPGMTAHMVQAINETTAEIAPAEGAKVELA